MRPFVAGLQASCEVSPPLYAPSVHSLASQPPSTIGVKLYVATEVVTLGALLVASWMFAGGSAWPPVADLSRGAGAVLTGALIASSLVLVVGRSRPTAALVFAAILGAVFTAMTIVGWQQAAAEGIVLGGSRFADCFYITTAFHLVHVAVGSVLLLFAARRGRWSGPLVWFWHITVVSWLPIAVTFYAGLTAGVL